MKISRIANLTILSVLLGASVFVCAQDEKQQDNSPKQEEAKPGKQDETKPAKQQNNGEMKQNEAKPSKQDKQEEKQEKQNNKQMQQEQGGSGQAAPENQQSSPNRQQQQMQDHGAAQQPGQPASAQNSAPGGNGNGRGGHIPDQQFHAHFGRSHSFRAQTVIVSGQPQFQYSGYTFELVDAWPADWAYTDDCYIDYIDGEYFLFDLLHPGIRIAVFVVM
jgi:hypothetical protein